MMLPRHAAMRSSGARLLGDVPSHWRIAKLRSVARPRNERNRADLPLLSVARERGVFVRAGSGEDNHNVIPDDLSNYKVACQGDLVINKMKAWQGSMGVAPCDGIVSPAYFVFRLDVEHVRFGQALLRSRPYVGMFAAASDGVRVGQWDLSIAGMKEIPVLLPPGDEQVAIVRFLDHVGGRIERAIRAKRKVVALLQEQKQSIVHHAVTRGVDGAPCSKPVELPSIGSVPDSWSFEPFVRCAVERADYRGATPDKVASGVFLVTARNIKKGWIDYECSREFVRASDYAKIMRRGRPKVGDILLTTEAPLGHVACVDREDVAIAQRVIRFRLAPDRMLSGFALLCLNDAYVQDQLAERATGSTAQGIKASKLPQLLVVVPTIAEQGRIIEVVHRKTEPIDRVIVSKTREIEMLGEFRIRLAADVVTGKLDVRGAAANLPDVAADSGAMKPDSADDSIDEEAVVE